MICIHPADDVREYISGPIELVMSSLHQFVQRASKSAVTIEQIGNSSFSGQEEYQKLCKRFRSLFDFD